MFVSLLILIFGTIGTSTCECEGTVLKEGVTVSWGVSIILPVVVTPIILYLGYRAYYYFGSGEEEEGVSPTESAESVCSEAPSLEAVGVVEPAVAVAPSPEAVGVVESAVAREPSPEAVGVVEPAVARAPSPEAAAVAERADLGYEVPKGKSEEA
jgi:hypothetical protein